MASEVTTFEIEENELEFNEMCSTLKNHPFNSPWGMFFKSKHENNDQDNQVSEFTIDNDNVMEVGTNLKILDSNGEPKRNQSNNAKDSIRNDMYTATPFDEKKICQLKESLMNAQENSTVSDLKDVDIFFMISSDEISRLFTMLDVQSLSEDSLTLLLKTFLHFKDNISIVTATGLVSHIICPVIFDLKQSTLRSLLTTILQFSEAFPKAVIDEMIVPNLKDKPLDNHQLELLNQVSKIHIPNDYVSYCIKNILESAPPVESTFMILQNLTERKVPHEKELYDQILKKLLSWTQTCSGSVKFTKLLTSILSAYGSYFDSQQIQLCDEVIRDNKTIIKKAAENLLKKLKQDIE